MPRLEGWPAPRCSQCEKQECTCKVNTTEVATANTTEVTTAKAVVCLTVELPLTHAAELVSLLSSHVSFLDFPWAKSIHDALHSEGIRGKHVFRDAEFGLNIYLERKRD